MIEPLFDCAMQWLNAQSLKRSNLPTWIERIAQAVAQQVERQHGEHDGDAGEEHEARRVEYAVALVTQHQPPFSGRRLRAEAAVAAGAQAESSSAAQAATANTDVSRLFEVIRSLSPFELHEHWVNALSLAGAGRLNAVRAKLKRPAMQALQLASSCRCQLRETAFAGCAFSTTLVRNFK